jgi:hypothetical protein
MSKTTTVTLGDRTFELDAAKAEAAFASKKVINGKDTMFFNILLRLVFFMPIKGAILVAGVPVFSSMFNKT